PRSMPDSSRNPSRGPPRKDLPLPKATDRPGIRDRKNPTPPDRARNRPIPGRNRIPAEVTTAATTLTHPPTPAVTTAKAPDPPPGRARNRPTPSRTRNRPEVPTAATTPPPPPTRAGTTVKPAQIPVAAKMAAAKPPARTPVAAETVAAAEAKPAAEMAAETPE